MNDIDVLMRYQLEKDIQKYDELCKLRISEPITFEKKLELVDFEYKNEIETNQFFSVNAEISLTDLSVDLNDDGIKYIDHFLPHKKAKELSQCCHKKNGSLSFFITKEKTLAGKIIQEIQPYKQEVKLAFVGEQITQFGELISKVYFFDEKVDKRKLRISKELIAEFYIYQFLSNHKIYLIFSVEQLPLEYFTLEGTLVKLSDSFPIGQIKTLNINLPILILHKAHKIKPEYKSKSDLIAKCKQLQLTQHNFYNYLFSDGKGLTFSHPPLFCELISAFIFSAKQDGYPLHLKIIAKPGTGKSSLENYIWLKFDEDLPVIEGSASTIKSLVPNFKGNIPDAGAVMKSNRIAIIDEFLRLLLRVDHQDDRQAQLSMLNPILDHQTRACLSGNGGLRSNPTARVLAVSNPVWNTETINTLCKKIDNSFLSRWLIWYQEPNHIEFIQQKKGICSTTYIMNKTEFLSIVDYLHSFCSTFDIEKVLQIFSRGLTLLGMDTEQNIYSYVRDVYNARYRHHIFCLIDGIIKTRCICSQDATFTAIEQDYDLLNKIWITMIANWTDVSITAEDSGICVR